MNKRILIFFFIALVAPFISAGQSSSKTQKISEEKLREWVTYLSNDDMRGRQNGSPEMVKAANYLANTFKKLGLKPLPGKDSYFQEYTIKSPGSKAPYTERNVIAVLEGSDKILKNEYIIVTAHFDHIGVGKAVAGDSIYNGADDNATGVATILGIAQAISEMKGKAPKRSIVFIAFSGEEMGMLGSKHFAQTEMEIVQKAVVNLNFEMTGHSTKLGKRKFFISGDDLSSLTDVLKKETENSGWEHIPDPFKEMNLFFRSDNVSFAVLKKENNLYHGIPAHTFCTWGAENHYHQPNDEPDIVDYENMASFVNFMSKVTLNLANSKETIEWTDDRFKRL
jgi:hypothetical protein